MELPAVEPQRIEKAPGWARWAGLGCGLIVLALIGALVVGVFRADRVVDWGLRRLTERVMQTLPGGVPDAARDELRRKLSCAMLAAREGRVTPARIGELARACTDALADREINMIELEHIDTLAGAICREGGPEAGT